MPATTPVIRPRLEPNPVASEKIPLGEPAESEPSSGEKRRDSILPQATGTLPLQPSVNFRNEYPLATVNAVPRPSTPERPVPAVERPPLVEAPRVVVKRTVDVRIGSVELRVQQPKPPETPRAASAPTERPPTLDEYAARRSYQRDDL